MNVQDMHSTAGQVCGLMKVLSNRTRRDGQTIYYALDRADVKDLMAFLYATYCSAEPAYREEELCPS